MDTTLRIFIGSSSEGLPVAQELARQLRQHPNLTPSLWNEGTFELSKTYIESLETELAKAHFAILVLTPDDVQLTRAVERLAPRDNLIFELGLFIGRMGRERCFIVHEKDALLKLPSDLLGVRPAGYKTANNESLCKALARPAELIAQHVAQIGPRAITSDEVIKQIELARGFADRLTGAWWERFQLEGNESVTFFRIRPDATTNSIRMDGDAYGPAGEWEAHWETVSVRLAPGDRKLYYAWQGTHPRSTAPAELFRGFGEMTFDDTTGNFTLGQGSFSDIAGVSSIANWKSVSVRRVERQDDIATMSSGRAAEKKAIVLRVLSEF